jgi:hypothetical protein
MVKRYGADAAMQASMRADAPLEAGDVDGQAIWKRILGAIKELQTEELVPGARVHITRVRPAELRGVGSVSQHAKKEQQE